MGRFQVGIRVIGEVGVLCKRDVANSRLNPVTLVSYPALFDLGISIDEPLDAAQADALVTLSRRLFAERDSRIRLPVGNDSPDAEAVASSVETRGWHVFRDVDGHPTQATTDEEYARLGQFVADDEPERELVLAWYFNAFTHAEEFEAKPVCPVHTIRSVKR